MIDRLLNFYNVCQIVLLSRITTLHSLLSFVYQRAWRCCGRCQVIQCRRGHVIWSRSAEFDTWRLQQLLLRTLFTSLPRQRWRRFIPVSSIRRLVPVWATLWTF